MDDVVVRGTVASVAAVIQHMTIVGDVATIDAAAGAAFGAAVDAAIGAAVGYAVVAAVCAAVVATIPTGAATAVI